MQIDHYAAPPVQHRAYLRHLPFDRANYGATSVPCQLLAATYGMTGLHYHVHLGIGIDVSIGKKQLQELMLFGAYACVADPIPTVVRGGPGLSIQIRLSAVRSGYANRYQDPISPADLQSMLGQWFPSLPKSGPRKIYSFDEMTGRGSNLNPIHGGAA